jgi:hypothetical protein
MDLETYPDEVLVHRSDDIICHANHCLYSDGYRYENDESRENSVARCDRMNSLLQAHKGNLNLKTLQTILADHGSKPYAICWHADASKPHQKQMRTLDSMVYVLERGEAWIAKGNPCETAFAGYAV